MPTALREAHGKEKKYYDLVRYISKDKLFLPREHYNIFVLSVQMT
jgi:hypothetical protein